MRGLNACQYLLRFIIRQGYCDGVMDANVVGGLGGGDGGYRVNGGDVDEFEGRQKVCPDEYQLEGDASEEDSLR